MPPATPRPTSATDSATSTGRRSPASTAATDRQQKLEGDRHMLPASIRRLRPDVFVMALAGTVTVATLLPCQGTSARIFHASGLIAIATLFFLQGARLSREVDPRRHDQLEAARHDRRHNLRAVSPAGNGAHCADAACTGPLAGVGRAVPVRSAIHRAVVHRVDLDRAGQRGRGGLRGNGIEPDGDGVHAVAVRLHVACTRRRRGGLGDVAGVRRAAAAIRPRPSAAARGSARGRRETSLCWRSPTVARS